MLPTYRQVGTASFSPPRDYANVLFESEWVEDLHYVRYYQEGFTTVIVNLGCVNHDYSAGCTAAVSYSDWRPGWAVIP
jgi:hypothetical protein